MLVPVAALLIATASGQASDTDILRAAAVRLVVRDVPGDVEVAPDRARDRVDVANTISFRVDTYGVGVAEGKGSPLRRVRDKL